MSIDVKTIIPQIFLYFHRYTVRVTTLKQFCAEASVEYKKMLGFSKVRWLALTPAIERIIKLFEPLRSYFLSLEKCPKTLKDFFENEVFEALLIFIHNQAVLFSNAIKKIEGTNIALVEVIGTLQELKEMYISRYNLKFVPIIVESMLRKLEESNSRIRQKFTNEMLVFYKTCSEYLEQWTDRLKDFNCLNWTLLHQKISWSDIQKTITFLESNNIKNINDNNLFDEIRRVNTFCEENQRFTTWAENGTETDKKWTDIFTFFKTEGIPFTNLKIIIEAVLCLPGTNASVERTFSIINDFWGCEKSRLTVNVLSAVITTKENLKIYNCEQFANILTENENLTKAIHSSNKYEN